MSKVINSRVRKFLDETPYKWLKHMTTTGSEGGVIPPGTVYHETLSA